MMEPLVPNHEATSEASKPSIIQEFSIDGLFGYRSVSLKSNYAATVLIARNGSGKTTLLAALDAFLRGQFTRFIGLEFEKVTCKLKDVSMPLVLYKTDIDQLSNISALEDFIYKAKSWEVEPLALLELLELDLESMSSYDLHDNPTFYAIYQKTSYDIPSCKTNCLKLASTLYETCPSLDALRKVLRQQLKNIDILYLPTYRRIELSLPESDNRRPGRKKGVLARLGVARSGLQTADIQFGLGDISDRLKSLYSEMLFISNQGYGTVSANIINDLISGDYKKNKGSSNEIPTQDSLEIFFSRIKDADLTIRSPFRNFFSAPDLNRVYKGDVPDDAKPFLDYFLSQLNSVIKETKESEELVEAFINNCNRYLSGIDPSTDDYSIIESSYIDNKQLTFNRRNFEVKVTSLAGKYEVPIEALSSGEKQMISLFARLYLYPKSKIVLIDEPELSLSLDWQRQILPDVLKAPTCSQVIAITHSPFIFDNELEKFAGSVRLRIDPHKKLQSKRNDLFESDGDE